MPYNTSNLDYGMGIPEDTSQGITYNPYLSTEGSNVYTDSNNPYTQTYVDAEGGYPREVNVNIVNPYSESTAPIAALLSKYESGSAAAQMFQPYDILNEDISRRALSNDIQSSLVDIEMIAANSMKTRGKLSSAMGKAGFAGSGLALTSQDYIEAKHSTAVSQEHSGIRGSILSHMIDVRKKRQGYVDELWGAFNDYLSTDPTPVELLEGYQVLGGEDYTDESLPGGGDTGGGFSIDDCYPNC